MVVIILSDIKFEVVVDVLCLAKQCVVSAEIVLLQNSKIRCKLKNVMCAFVVMRSADFDSRTF